MAENPINNSYIGTLLAYKGNFFSWRRLLSEEEISDIKVWFMSRHGKTEDNGEFRVIMLTAENLDGIDQLVKNIARYDNG